MIVDDAIPAVPQIEVSSEARLGHDGWVSEFESFQWADKKGNGGGGAAPVSARSGRSTMERGTSGGGDPTKAMDNLRAEIKLLHWHKLANEAALKAALLKTRKIKARGGGTSRPVPAMTTLSMPPEERAVWMQQVIEEEQSKPLQVSKDFMCKYEEQEKETEGRLDTEVAAHIRSLRNLRKQIEKRGEMKARRIKYRAAQKQLELEKQQLLLGKLHETGSSGSMPSSRETRDDTAVAAGKLGSGQGTQKRVGALDTVLGSLDKLVELEKRISSLEKSNVYDDFRATKQGSATESRWLGRRRISGSRVPSGAASHRRSAEGRPGVAGSRNRRLSFSKQTTEATIDAPSHTYYSVRVRRKPGSTAGNRTALKRRYREDVDVGRRTASAREGGASTFLTQLPDVHRHQRVGQQSGGGRGGGFRSAIGEKKRIEAKRRLTVDRAEAERVARQDRIIREWMQRKRAAAAASGSRQRKPSVLPAHARGRPGISPTNRKHMHLQEFRNIRAHYSKRSERLRRDLSRRQGGAGGGALLSGTRTAAVARPRAPVDRSGVTSSRSGMVSRTNPGLQRRREAVRASVEAKRRTLMRRTGPGPRLAVGGTGLRAARARRQDSEPAAPGTRRRDRSRPQRTTAVLPVVRGTGRRAVG